MISKKVIAEFREEFDREVGLANNILITSHRRPDSDSVASVLSLWFYLKNNYPDKNIRIIYTTPIGNGFSGWPLGENIEAVNDIADIINEYDMAIFLDGNDFMMFSNKPDKLTEYKKTTVRIDHHPTEGKVGYTLSLVDKVATSATELIYYAFFEDEKKLDQDVAKILFLGLSSDTGNFRYIRPENANAFILAKRLVEEGKFNVEELLAQYFKYSIKGFEIFQEFIKNFKFVKKDGWPKMSVSYVTRDYVNSHHCTLMDIKEGSNLCTLFLKEVEGIGFGFVASPDGKNTHISFRSVPGSVNVRKIAEGLSIGGGHNVAAAGVMKGKNPEEALEVVYEWLKHNDPIASGAIEKK